MKLKKQILSLGVTCSFLMTPLVVLACNKEEINKKQDSKQDVEKINPQTIKKLVNAFKNGIKIVNNTFDKNIIVKSVLKNHNFGHKHFEEVAEGEQAKMENLVQVKNLTIQDDNKQDNIALAIFNDGLNEVQLKVIISSQEEANKNNSQKLDKKIDPRTFDMLLRELTNGINIKSNLFEKNLIVSKVLENHNFGHSHFEDVAVGEEAKMRSLIQIQNLVIKDDNTHDNEALAVFNDGLNELTIKIITIASENDKISQDLIEKLPKKMELPIDWDINDLNDLNDKKEEILELIKQSNEYKSIIDKSEQNEVNSLLQFKFAKVLKIVKSWNSVTKQETTQISGPNEGFIQFDDNLNKYLIRVSWKIVYNIKPINITIDVPKFTIPIAKPPKNNPSTVTLQPKSDKTIIVKDDPDLGVIHKDNTTNKIIAKPLSNHDSPTTKASIINDLNSNDDEDGISTLVSDNEDNL